MRVLFVCVGNTCRSQMAEAIARYLGHDSASAGTHPGSVISPNAITALSELGIDSSGLMPKSIDTINWQSFDKVISFRSLSLPTHEMIISALKEANFGVSATFTL